MTAEVDGVGRPRDGDGEVTAVELCSRGAEVGIWGELEGSVDLRWPWGW